MWCWLISLPQSLEVNRMNWRIGCCFSTPRRSLRPEALAVRGDRLDYFRYADLADPYPPDAQPCCLRIADQSGILPSVLHKSRKCRIKPNPPPSRISGMIFSLNLLSRRSDTITQP